MRPPLSSDNHGRRLWLRPPRSRPIRALHPVDHLHRRVVAYWTCPSWLQPLGSAPAYPLSCAWQFNCRSRLFCCQNYRLPSLAYCFKELPLNVRERGQLIPRLGSRTGRSVGQTHDRTTSAAFLPRRSLDINHITSLI